MEKVTFMTIVSKTTNIFIIICYKVFIVQFYCVKIRSSSRSESTSCYTSASEMFEKLSQMSAQSQKNWSVSPLLASGAAGGGAQWVQPTVPGLCVPLSHLSGTQWWGRHCNLRHLTPSPTHSGVCTKTDPPPVTAGVSITLCRCLPDAVFADSPKRAAAGHTWARRSSPPSLWWPGSSTRRWWRDGRPESTWGRLLPPTWTHTDHVTWCLTVYRVKASRCLGGTHLVWAVSVRTVFRESLIHAATPSTQADISWTHTHTHRDGSVSTAYK